MPHFEYIASQKLKVSLKQYKSKIFETRRVECDGIYYFSKQSQPRITEASVIDSNHILTQQTGEIQSAGFCLKLVFFQDTWLRVTVWDLMLKGKMF